MLTKAMFIRCVVISVLSVLVPNCDSFLHLGYVKKNVSNVISNKRRNFPAKEQARGFFGHGKLFFIIIILLIF